MKLRRIVAGMAAAAMALAMTVVAHADDAANEYAVAQIYIQEEGGQYSWKGSGETEDARLKPGDTITLEWSPEAADLELFSKTGNPRIGVQLLNGAIAGQEGKEGSLKGSDSNIVISAGKGEVKLSGEDLVADKLSPKDEGGWFSGQSVDTNWIDTIKKQENFDDAAYNEWFATITKVTVTFKLDSMTPYTAPADDGNTDAGNTDNGSTDTGAADADNNNAAQTGAAAGAALALVAVAGAALVVSKKKN